MIDRQNYLLEDIVPELKKLRFHVEMLAGALDFDKNAFEYLVISNNWDQNDVSACHDIFEEYSKEIENSGGFDRDGFEMEFQRRLNVSDQEVKMIVVAFYRASLWWRVCVAYKNSYGNRPPMELWSIGADERVAEAS